MTQRPAACPGRPPHRRRHTTRHAVTAGGDHRQNLHAPSPSTRTVPPHGRHGTRPAGPPARSPADDPCPASRSRSAVGRLPIDPQLGTSLWIPGHGPVDGAGTGRVARPPSTPHADRSPDPGTAHPLRSTPPSAARPAATAVLHSAHRTYCHYCSSSLRRTTEDQGWGAPEPLDLHRAGVSDPPVTLYRDHLPGPARIAACSDPGGQR